MKALERAAARWGSAALLTEEATTPARRPPRVPSVREIESWSAGHDLNQLVTDSGAIPAGTVEWSQLPTNLWYPHGSPAGDIQAWVNAMQCPPEHQPGGGGVPTAS